MSRSRRSRNSAAPNPRAEAMRAQEAYYKLATDAITRTTIGGFAAYGGGNGMNRLATGWVGGDSYHGGVREQDYWTLAAERDRSRALERNNWLACGVLDRAVENVVGAEIRVEPRTVNPDFNKRARDRWCRWAYSTECDARGLFHLGKLLRLAYRMKVRDGDGGIMLAEEPNAGPLRLQVIEPDLIESPENAERRTENTPFQIIEGVELDRIGRPVGFYVRLTDRPQAGAPRHARVGARDLIFLHRGSRYSDVRGEPSFVGGFTLFDQIVGYLDAVVVAARVAACQALIITKNNPGTFQQNLPQQLRASSVGINAPTTVTERRFPMQPGMAHALAIGEDVKGFNPTQPTQSFRDAVVTFGRFVGLKFGLTIEQVLLDFSQTNYSSSRAARIQAEATASIEQADFAAEAVSRIYRWAVSKWVERGEIPGPVPENFWAHEWIPQARPWVDPLKEIQAAKEAVKLGVDARSNVAMSQGYDFTELCERNKADRAQLEAAGLPTSLASKDETDELRTKVDAYGIGVRAGVLTPNVEDEKHFRGEAGLPDVSAAVTAAWEAEGGVRKLITVQQEDQAAPADEAKPEDEPDADDPDDDEEE